MNMIKEILGTNISQAARYFDVEEKYVYCSKDRFVIDPKQAVDLIDENTIGVCIIPYHIALHRLMCLDLHYPGHYLHRRI